MLGQVYGVVLILRFKVYCCPPCRVLPTLFSPVVLRREEHLRWDLLVSLFARRTSGFNYRFIVFCEIKNPKQTKHPTLVKKNVSQAFLLASFFVFCLQNASYTAVAEIQKISDGKCKDLLSTVLKVI